MPEIINDKKVFSLLEVTLSIQKTLNDRYGSSFWIRAEMNKLNYYSYSGHCYPELVDKMDGKVVALMKSVLWKNDFNRVNDKFLAVLKEPLKDGIKILFSATITFDPSYGLSLRIIDVDPSYSLGELEREKQETIERLRQEGTYSLNKELPLALVPQRIAIISVETSKGYADFLKILSHNPWGYKVFAFLFPALLQGDNSADSIIYQLDRIARITHHFDAVAIIRGGGGDVGLSSYNHYELAHAVATFPLPVLTGIGHSTNETVVEMVSYMNAITPTELADFLMQKFHNFSVPVKKAEATIADQAIRLLKEEKLRFLNMLKYLKSVSKHMLDRTRYEMETHRTALIRQSKSLITSHRDVLTSSAKAVELLDPINILKRGFTLTLRDGKAVRNPAEVRKGESITTVFATGQISSKVE